MMRTQDAASIIITRTVTIIFLAIAILIFVLLNDPNVRAELAFDIVMYAFAYYLLGKGYQLPAAILELIELTIILYLQVAGIIPGNSVLGIPLISAVSIALAFSTTPLVIAIPTTLISMVPVNIIYIQTGQALDLYATYNGVVLVIALLIAVTRRAYLAQTKATAAAARRELQAIESKKQAETAQQVAEQVAQNGQMFISMISHEFRTPVNVIHANTQMLQDFSDLDEDQSKLVGATARSTQRLIRLINNLLDMQAVSAGYSTPIIEAVDPRILITEEIDEIRPLYTQKSLALNVHFETELPIRVATDRQKIQTILSNLLRNAQKYCERGGTSVTSGINHENQWWIKIEDTGIGIQANEVSQIFQPFYQAGDKNDKRTHQGTGLGLAIVKRNIELLGGAISVTSIPEKGTTFLLKFPLQDTKNIVSSLNTTTDTNPLPAPTSPPTIATEPNKDAEKVSSTP